jgi:DNA-binding beta-propeller fold protein YncE
MSRICFGWRRVALALLLLTLPITSLAQPAALLVSTVPLDGAPPTIRRMSLTGDDLGVFASVGLNGALGLALDRAGNVYVANVGDGTIHRFSAAGADLGVFAAVRQPVALTFDSAGNLYVSDILDNTIHKFSPAGQDLGVITSLLGFGCPADLVVSRAGTLLVADACSSVIREFSTTGASLGIFASAGLSNPLGVALDREGNLFVSNTGGAFQNTIHKFSAAGEDLGVFASTGLAFAARLAIDSSGNLYAANMQPLPGAAAGSIRKFSPAGQDLGNLATIAGVPLALVVTVPAFAGTPGLANCHGRSVSALNRQFGNMPLAAVALGFPSVRVLQDAIQVFCGG